MIPSIRRFLLFNLLLSITITSSLTAVGNYFLDNADIQRHLDTHLSQTTNFLEVLLIDNYYPTNRIHKIQKIINTQANHKRIIEPVPQIQDRFQFQVWNNQGKLILHSPHAVNFKLSDKKNGFSDKKLGDQSWRVYSKYNANLQVTILVGELYNFREQLEKRITWDNLLIILWTYPLLGLLIWLTVGRGLDSLKKLTELLSGRNASDFRPVVLHNTPIEIQPVIEELNKLFAKLHEEFMRNKRFASDAAHELRTPLAALKTQSQVALLSKDPQERKEVLKKIILSVDRLTHIVHQLLTLSRLGPEAVRADAQQVNFSFLTAEIIAELAPTALEKNIDIELIKPKTNITLEGSEVALSILVRNLVDNAIRYSPHHGSVRVTIEQNKKTVTFKVCDSGPGIPEELRKRIFERFYRVPGTKASGSGLGLAIVQQIAQLHHTTTQLAAAEIGDGLEVVIVFPKKL